MGMEQLILSFQNLTIIISHSTMSHNRE